jgi:sigma-B regulation protein RsbU (phosphoserine phosphatase)
VASQRPLDRHSPSVDRLETLYQVSQALGSTLHLDILLNAVIDQVIGVTRAERGFLMLGAGPDELQFRVARGMDQTTISSPEFQVSRGVVERVAGEGKAVLTSDAQAEEWLARRKSVASKGLRSIMCVPLRLRGESIGLVYVDNRLQAGIFDHDDLDLLEAVANTAAVAIENARLHEREIEQARLERELELARQIQVSLMPHDAPQFPGFDIAGFWRVAREVGGDFYDFIPRPGGGLGIVIGDVTDKGVPAAFFMALARTTIRSSLAAAESPLAGIQQANRLLCADASSGMFVTLYYIGLGPGSRTFTGINAGHNPPLHFRASDRIVAVLPRGGLPLGIDEAAAFGEIRLELDPGEALLLYTDGVVDAESEALESFGLQRLMEAVKQNGHRPAVQMVEAIEDSVEAFAAGRPPFDDLTMVAVKCVG